MLNLIDVVPRHCKKAHSTKTKLSIPTRSFSDSSTYTINHSYLFDFSLAENIFFTGTCHTQTQRLKDTSISSHLPQHELGPCNPQ